MFSQLKLSINGKISQIRNNKYVSSVVTYASIDKKHLLLVAALVLAIPLTVTLALTQQELRQHADFETPITPPDITPTPTASESASPTPTETPLPTLTPTPTIVPTITPSPTKTPKPTPTPRPTPTPIAATLNPVADAFVSNQAQNINFGTSGILKVEGNPSYISFLKYDLRPYKTQNILSAILRLHVSTTSSITVLVRDVHNTSWEERRITYKNKPADDPKIRGGFTGGTQGQWVEVDLTSYLNSIKGNVISFDLRSNDNSMISFDSRETSFAPKLILSIKK